nr:uncharacterized protein LOC105434843 isoform X3 [Ipomoea batatas]GMD72221.1 uncharacterized protein LOC105434843 isoform X3 [Ipomoea batatas]
MLKSYLDAYRDMVYGQTGTIHILLLIQNMKLLRLKYLARWPFMAISIEEESQFTGALHPGQLLQKLSWSIMRSMCQRAYMPFSD